MHEFVVFWPREEQLELFERVTADVIPGLHARSELRFAQGEPP
jgi:hypothetical protein